MARSIPAPDHRSRTPHNPAYPSGALRGRLPAEFGAGERGHETLHVGHVELGELGDPGTYRRSRPHPRAGPGAGFGEPQVAVEQFLDVAGESTERPASSSSLVFYCQPDRASCDPTPPPVDVENLPVRDLVQYPVEPYRQFEPGKVDSQAMVHTETEAEM
jgi:hypothetical protein